MSSPSQGIDRKFLVLADKTALPQRCVRTNQPIAENEYRAWDLPCIPRWLQIVMLLVPFLLIAQPYAARHRCRFKAGVSRAVQLKYVRLKMVAILVILGSLIAPIMYAAVGLDAWMTAAIVLFPLFFWGGFWILILFTSPLKIVKHEDGLFWLEGCSPKFLESLKGEVAGRNER